MTVIILRMDLKWPYMDWHAIKINQLAIVAKSCYIYSHPWLEPVSERDCYHQEEKRGNINEDLNTNSCYNYSCPNYSCPNYSCPNYSWKPSGQAGGSGSVDLDTKESKPNKMAERQRCLAGNERKLNVLSITLLTLIVLNQVLLSSPTLGCRVSAALAL